MRFTIPKIMLGLAAFKTEEGCLTRPEDQLSKVTRYDHMSSLLMNSSMANSSIASATSQGGKHK